MGKLLMVNLMKLPLNQQFRRESSDWIAARSDNFICRNCSAIFFRAKIYRPLIEEDFLQFCHHKMFSSLLRRRHQLVRRQVDLDTVYQISIRPRWTRAFKLHFESFRLPSGARRALKTVLIEAWNVEIPRKCLTRTEIFQFTHSIV